MSPSGPNQALLEAKLQVFDLDRLGVCILVRHLTARDEVLVAVEPEDESKASDPQPERGDWMSPVSPQSCFRIVAADDPRQGQHSP